MSDFPGFDVLPTAVSPLAQGLAGAARGVNNTGVQFSQNAWPTANTAIYQPLFLPYRYPVARVWWHNAAVAGNVDFGIYAEDGTRLYSTGSTAASGANAPQSVTPSPKFILEPGAYYIGLACSSTSETMWSLQLVNALQGRQIGLHQEASAFPLPATMTPVTFTGTMIPHCGLWRTTAGG